MATTAPPKTSTATKAGAPKPGAQPTPAAAIKAPPFRMERGARREKYLKLLIYGNYGVGKTTLAATACEVPQMKDVIMINAEAGDLSVIGDDVTTITTQTFRQFARIHEYLRQHCKWRDEDDVENLRKSQGRLMGLEEDEIESIGEPLRFRTAIIDSLTEIEAYCFNQLLGVTDSTKLDDEVQGAEWAEYKKNHGMILRTVRAFRDLPMHVIFTAGEQFTQDEQKRQKFSPDFTGKLSKKVQGFMDMVGYYVIGKDGESTVRRLYVSPSPQGRYDAKHRYTAFKGEYFQDPTIGKILKEVGLLEKEGAALK